MNKPFNTHFKDYNFSKEKVKESFIELDFLLKKNDIDSSFFHERIEKESERYFNNGYPKETHDYYYHLMSSDKEVSIILFITECHQRRYHNDSYWGKQYDNGFFIKREYVYKIQKFLIDEFKFQRIDIFMELMRHYKNDLLKKIYINETSIEDVILFLQEKNIKLEREIKKIKNAINEFNKKLV